MRRGVRQSIVYGLLLCAITALAASSASAQVRVARTFEQLQVLVGNGETVSLLDTNGDEFPARVIDVTATELVVEADGRRRVLQQGDVQRIRQRRRDPLGNGTWIGLGIGAGLAGLGLAAIAADDYESVGGAGWAAFALGVYGAAGAGAGAGIDALIRTNQVIYDNTAAAGNLSIVPFVQRTRIGAAIAFRF